ncbi:hypothetical protein OAE61_04490 [Verrucomicrobiales bacterium]|nr:hypothetical protein [Verrucomicrobiales bacterium]MDC0259170.1 hypothetical protein [Verrucomicrobiales bacterium]
MAKTKNTVNRQARRTRKKKRKSPSRAATAFTQSHIVSRWLDFSAWTPLLTIKFFIGLLLLPVVWVSIETFFVSFGHAAKVGAFWRTGEFWFFTIGAIVWTVIFCSWRHRYMVYLYVAGHEYTHAFFVLLCRGNVAEVKISSAGGHILTNRNNFLISLSPYFFPFYTIILITLWALVEWLFFDFTDAHRQILFGLIGLTWAFHLTFTIWMIRREQPDVDQNGKLFSFSMIAVVNMLVISGLLIVASPNVALSDFAAVWCANLLTFGRRFIESIQEMWSIFPWAK